MVVYIFSLLYLAVKFKHTMGGLNPLLRSAVILLFIVCLGVAVALFYYLGEWSANIIGNSFALMLTQFFTFLIVLSICFGILYAVLTKLAENLSE